MNTKELEFLDHLLRSTGGENIVVVDEEREHTLQESFGVCGKHAHNKIAAGFYVYGDADWQIMGDFEPSVMYILADNDSKLSYFPPVL